MNLFGIYSFKSWAARYSNKTINDFRNTIDSRGWSFIEIDQQLEIVYKMKLTTLTGCSVCRLQYWAEEQRSDF